MRLKLICAVLVGVLVVTAGCGSKKKSAATTKATTTSQSTTSTSGGTKLTSADCTRLLAAKDTVNNATQGTIPPNIAEITAGLQTAAAAAPARLKPDFQLLGQAIAKFESLNIKPGTTLSAQQQQKVLSALSSLNLAKLGAAAAAIQTWAGQVCKK